MLKTVLQTLKQCLGGDVICAAGVQSQVQVLIDWVHNMCKCYVWYSRNPCYRTFCYPVTQLFVFSLLEQYLPI